MKVGVVVLLKGHWMHLLVLSILGDRDHSPTLTRWERKRWEKPGEMGGGGSFPRGAARRHR